MYFIILKYLADTNEKLNGDYLCFWHFSRHAMKEKKFSQKIKMSKVKEI